jgi:hypothetical protein
MISKVLLIAFTSVHFFTIYIEGGHLRNRALGYYQDGYYNGTNIDDASNDYDNGDDVSNSTLTYIRDKILNNYVTSADEWHTTEWSIFAFAMFLFGSLASMFFMCVVFPCCCPSRARTLYALCIAPRLVEEDPKKVRLIKA